LEGGDVVAKIVMDYKKMPSTDRQNIVADNNGIIIPEDEMKGLAEIKNTKEIKEVENVELEIVIGILGT